jgi:hypothetical protein
MNTNINESKTAYAWIVGFVVQYPLSLLLAGLVNYVFPHSAAVFWMVFLYGSWFGAGLAYRILITGAIAWISTRCVKSAGNAILLACVTDTVLVFLFAIAFPGAFF